MAKTLIVAGILSALCFGCDTGGGEAAEDPPVCVDPAMAGPFAAGRVELAIPDTLRGGEMAIRATFPAVFDGDGAGSEADDAMAPYPVVLISHGSFMEPAHYDATADRLASHGFVVLAPAHQDTLTRVAASFEASCEAIPDNEQLARVGEAIMALYEEEHPIRRPGDLARVLDAGDAIEAAAPVLEGMMDMERVAVVGHSFGGYSGLMAAGATIDTDAVASTCADGPQVADLLLDQVVRFLTCANFATVPEAMLASPIRLLDDRVDALVDIAGPLRGLWGDDFAGLATIAVPTLMIYTDTDEHVPFSDVQPAFEALTAEGNSLTTPSGGNHGNFGDIDFDAIAAMAAEFPEGCAYADIFQQLLGDASEQPELPKPEQNAITATATTTFLCGAL